MHMPCGVAFPCVARAFALYAITPHFSTQYVIQPATFASMHHITSVRRAALYSASGKNLREPRQGKLKTITILSIRCCKGMYINPSWPLASIVGLAFGLRYQISCNSSHWPSNTQRSCCQGSIEPVSLSSSLVSTSE